MLTHPKFEVGIACFVYANRFEFGPHDFATGEFHPLWIFPPIGFRVPGGLTLGLVC